MLIVDTPHTAGADEVFVSTLSARSQLGVLAIEIDEVSAKTRSGPPGDDAEDYELPIWAGVIPVTTSFGSAIDDPVLRDGLQPPEYVTRYRR